MSVQCAMCMERYFAEAAANLKLQLGLLNSEQIPLTTNHWWCNLGFVCWLDCHHHPLECCELSQQCWPPPASLGGPDENFLSTRQGKARQALLHKCSHSGQRPSHPHKVFGQKDSSIIAGVRNILLILWTLWNILSCNLETDSWLRKVTNTLRLNNCAYNKTK